MFILNELFTSVGLFIKLVVNFVLAAVLYPIQLISSFFMDGAIKGDYTEGGSTVIILILLVLFIGAGISLLGYVVKGGILLVILTACSAYILGFLVSILILSWLIRKSFTKLNKFKLVCIKAFQSKRNILKKS
ncbi:hypothetical protein A5819_003586 [Enterococcus sp. 7E2_DIV0204]|uniref:hypothetical protein n=1 Tax=unclassified Enterococcus TaxID=2608891 RepID=UPI000A33CDAF|nr:MULTISPECIES: hypothetical protein [unclassified Enterococcus]OTN84036.1 hypothetical protein A5819_003586 [Enterococcus sp. 7E2_DIV0204]OTP47181.1 hypothetical protein A5884_003556 [Enterococcus sp. 7D2_DIV0200]